MKTRIVIFKVARSARTGRYITKKAARRRPSTTIVETMRMRVRVRRGR